MLGVKLRTSMTTPIQRWSLSISVLVTLLCLPLLVVFTSPLSLYHDRSFLLRIGLTAAVLCLFWGAALTNLIQAESRGYSRRKCAVAVIMLGVAFVSLVLAGIQILFAAFHLP